MSYEYYEHTNHRRQLEAGDHLVGVYGDNWLRAASFSLMAIPLSARATEEQASVVSVDAQLVAQREQLKAFKVGYNILYMVTYIVYCYCCTRE